MKKKILAALTCMALALSLTACAENREAPLDSTPQSNQSSTSTSTDSSKSSVESTPLESSSEPEQSSEPEKSSPAPEQSSAPEQRSSAPTQSSSKPEQSSQPVQSSSKPVQSSSTPQSSTKPVTPADPYATNWDNVPYATDEDFDYEIVGNLQKSYVNIKKYIGKNQYVKMPDELVGEKVIRVTNEVNWGNNVLGIKLSDACTLMENELFKDTWRGTFVYPTGIGDGPNVTEIVFPDSWEAIGAAGTLYGGMPKLQKFNFPKNVKRILRDGFSGTGVTSITLPSTLETINAHAFQNCKKMTSVTFPKSFSSGKCTIVGYAFSGCTSLKSVELPNSLNLNGGRDIAVANNLFSGCTSLEKVTIADGITQIPKYFFDGCTSLKEVNLPNGLTKLEEGIFRDCTSLKSLTIPDSVTEISEYFMSGCSGFTIYYLGQTFNDKNYVKIIGKR